MTELGEGLSLDGDFDLQLNAVGDLDKSDGLDELEKDLAMQTAYTLRNIIGQPDSPELSAEIKSLTRRVIEADDRVDEVLRNSIEIRRQERGVGVTYIISLSVIVSGDEQELVFEVEE